MPVDFGERCCEKCKYFIGNDEVRGFCWRYPPTPFPTGVDEKGGMQITSFRPTVQRAHGCGEWAVKLTITSDMPLAGRIQ